MGVPLGSLFLLRSGFYFYLFELQEAEKPILVINGLTTQGMGWSAPKFIQLPSESLWIEWGLNCDHLCNQVHDHYTMTGHTLLEKKYSCFFCLYFEPVLQLFYNKFILKSELQKYLNLNHEQQKTRISSSTRSGKLYNYEYQWKKFYIILFILFLKLHLRIGNYIYNRTIFTIIRDVMWIKIYIMFDQNWTQYFS